MVSPGLAFLHYSVSSPSFDAPSLPMYHPLMARADGGEGGPPEAHAGGTLIDGTAADGAGPDVTPPPMLEATRRNVTVLFADLAGFTELTERLGEERTHALLNELFGRFEHEILRRGGSIDKFIGDEVMALFGAERANEDDPERAVGAALSIVESVGAFGREKGIDLAVHVGINTGRVVAGMLGGAQRRDFSVIGSGVNIAARLAGHARAGEILCGAETVKRLRGRFEAEAVENLRLKGIREPVTAYRVLGARTARELLGATAASGEAPGPEGLSMPFAGRENELARLREAIAGLGAGSSSAPAPAPARGIAVVGPGGIGKTRLVAHLLAHDLPPGADVVHAQGDPHGDRLPFSTILPAIDRCLGIGSPAERPRSAEALGRFDPAHRDALARVYGLLGNGGAERDDGGEIDARNLVSVIADVIVATAPAAGRVLFVVDAQWIDAVSASVVAALAARPDGVGRAVLPILDARPEGEAVLEGFLGIDGVLRLDLEPMRGDGVTDLIGRLFPGASVPAGFVDALLARTGGTPIHIEQALNALNEQGLIRRDGWRIAPEAVALPIPATLVDLVVSRIDRLPPPARETLLAASILGGRFDTELLAPLVGRRPEETAGPLDALAAGRFLRREERDVFFHHETIREVAYGLLLERDRERLHAKAAEVLRGRTDWRDPESLDRLAGHCRGAKDWGGLVRVRMAGLGLAMDAYRTQDAERIAREILSMEWPAYLDDRVRAVFLGHRARIALVRRRHEEALALAEEALAIDRKTGDRPGEAARLSAVGRACEQMGRWDDAARQHTAALGIARDLGDEALQAMALGALGRILERRRRFDEARRYADEALGICRRNGDERGEAIHLQTLCRISQREGRLDEAKEHAEAALENARRRGHARGEAISLGTLGEIAEEEGHLDDAIRHQEAALGLNRRLGNDHGMTIRLGILARLTERAGRIEEAFRHDEAFLEIDRRLGDERGQATRLAELARLATLLGHADEADRYRKAAEELAGIVGDGKAAEPA